MTPHMGWATPQTMHVIEDKFECLEQIQDALAHEGLESSELIVGIDFTLSNRQQGRQTFSGRNLHRLSGRYQNPYQAALKIIAQSLQEYDDDQVYPVYRFGDSLTRHHSVLPLTNDMPEDGYQGFEQVEQAYVTAAQQLQLAGQTSFVPIIHQAMEIVRSRREGDHYPYHILLILTDGAVNHEVAQNIDAVVQASDYPLSIIVVGVGDGPWDKMIEFDDNIPKRAFDNLQFLNLHDHVRSLDDLTAEDEEDFAVAALQELPEQYAKIKQLDLMNARRHDTSASASASASQSAPREAQPAKKFKKPLWLKKLFKKQPKA
ncbi:MAG: VWA domain-containing protein [Zetaproteobacteria bacterium]|nr:VWA domain-containing protein [Zetaproteobacteria bacterium]